MALLPVDSSSKYALISLVHIDNIDPLELRDRSICLTLGLIVVNLPIASPFDLVQKWDVSVLRGFCTSCTQKQKTTRHETDLALGTQPSNRKIL